MRDSFVLYTKIKETIERLDNEQKGKLLQAILDYETEGDAEIDDPIVEIAFIPIRQDLDFTNAKWDETRKARSEAGKKGGRPKANESKEKQIKAKESFVKQSETKKAVNVHVNVNDNVNNTPLTPLQGYFPDEELNVAFNQYVDQCRNGKVDFQATQKLLFDLAHGDRDTMIAILQQSVAQGWTGLHEIKNKASPDKKSNKIHFDLERKYDFDELEQQLLNKQKQRRSV